MGQGVISVLFTSVFPKPSKVPALENSVNPSLEVYGIPQSLHNFSNPVSSIYFLKIPGIPGNRTKRKEIGNRKRPADDPAIEIIRHKLN